jgi:DNA-binding IclR family transcriptional regulator
LRNAYLIAKHRIVNGRASASGKGNGMSGKSSQVRRKRTRSASERAGVQSVVVAARVLKALAAHGGVATLKELAVAAAMPRAKVHRYLGSLRAGGLVAQNPETGRYEIGPTAVTIGLVGLSRVNPVRQLQDLLPRVRDRINATVTAAIWGERGPTIVAMEESDHLVTMNLRVGSVLPLLNTAIGRLFLAYLAPAQTARFVAEERAGPLGHAAPSEADLNDLLNNIRARRLSHVRGVLIPGVDAIAAPVFDYSERIVAVICAVGHTGTRITRWDGAAAQALREAAAELSAQLGSIAQGSQGDGALSPAISARSRRERARTRTLAKTDERAG